MCSLSISIHAPQWGATGDGSRRPRSGLISIHAPQWGATTAPGVPRPATADFNPRTPVGCDARLFPVDVYCNLFQSTHPSGVRPIPVGYRPVDKSFQSTHPSGVRPTLCGVLAGLVDFNPRTPVGCDSAGLERTTRPPEFQSTHPSGVRPNTMAQKMRRLIFQSTHPSGVRHARRMRSAGRNHFNPRTPVGCDMSICSPATSAYHFNPRTPVGCDRVLTLHAHRLAIFQSTHPSGVRLPAMLP